MEHYQYVLNWKDDFIENFILSFEKILSHYGTNPFLPMLWLLGIHIFDYIIRISFSDSYDKFKQQEFSIYSLNIIENYFSLLGIWILFKIVFSNSGTSELDNSYNSQYKPQLNP